MTSKWKFYILIFCSVVHAINVNLFHEETISWISPTDYRKILKVSFPFARCCNVYFNGSSVQVEQSFRHFVDSYPNDYLILKKSYDCQGYLLIASDEKKLLWALSKVPSTISSTELLIIFGDALPEESSLFNGSLYKNANANLVTTSGVWSLTENFIEPRTFERVERYEDLRYNNGLADFKGRELKVATFYNPPMCYLNRSVNVTVDGIESQIFLADNDVERDGIELQIFMLIAERLNFSWSMRKPTGGFRYGRRLANDTWQGGMIGQLVRKEIDIAFSGIWLKEDHNLFANLSAPWGYLSIRFLVPRPKPYTSFWALTRPFTPLVWVCILSVLLLQTCYMTVRSRLNPNEGTKRFRLYSNTCMEMTGRLIGMWVPRKITGAKVPLQFWQFWGLIIVTAYCSSLAASLAGAEYEERTDTVQQFIEHDLTWGRSGPIPIFNEYFDLNDGYSSRLPESFEHENSTEDRHRKIMKGNYAIVGRIIGGVFYPEGDVANDDLRNYRVMRDSVGGYYSCFAMQPWLLKKIDAGYYTPYALNLMMLWITETGFTSFYLRDVIQRRTGSTLREVSVEHDRNNGTARVLAFTPLASGFAMLSLGLIVSSIIFTLEVKSVNKLFKK